MSLIVVKARAKIRLAKQKYQQQPDLNINNKINAKKQDYNLMEQFNKRRK